MREVVPSGIVISQENDMLWFNYPERSRIAGTYGCQWLYMGQGPERDLLLRAITLALGDLQDFIEEAITEPWPGTRATPIVRPYSRIEGQVVLLGYREAAAPLLAMRTLFLER